MDTREMALLRIKLREVNIEYSALVRGNGGEGRFVRMAELRSERQALVDLIAKERGIARAAPRVRAPAHERPSPSPRV